MVNTKHGKIEFGQIVHPQFGREIQQSTQEVRRQGVEVIKMVQKGADGRTFSGYRKVNYTDQKLKEAYRKINKTLGGN